MKKLLAITDLTRMQRGCVCVAGYDQEGHGLRPILPPPGIKEATLFSGGQPMVFPFAVVEYDLADPQPQPPHTEDCGYDPASVKFVRRVKEEKRERVLGFSLFESVEAIFEQTVYDDWGFYVLDGCGPRSIGTVLPKNILEVKYEKDIRGKWDYRLRFTDNWDQVYRLKITDLTWHYFCDSRRDEQHTPAQIAAELSQMLASRKVYLRIGLARHWAEYPDRCYLQVNAIHTFPDYLEGKTFADFRTGPVRVAGLKDAPEKVYSAAQQSAPEKPKAHRVESVRRRFSKAYQRWSVEEDAHLKQQHALGLTVPELVQVFERNAGAIRSRLKKLGLIN